MKKAKLVVTRWDILWLVLPALLWIGLVNLRPFLIKPHCLQSSQCSQDQILALDRSAMGLTDATADGLSTATQNISGILALATPLLWHGGTILLRHANPAVAIASAGTDLLLIAEAMLWNGSMGESVRILTARPRPFVYQRPDLHGANPANYISFYSGHTSFAAASLMAIFFLFLVRGAPLWSLVFWGCVAQGMTFTTGILRIAAGRHFPTDVVAGAIAGSLIALVVILRHRQK